MRPRIAVVLAGAALAAGCAVSPETPAPEPVPRAAAPGDPARMAARMAARDRQLALARQAQVAGDLRGAVEHGQVALLLVPEDAALRRDLDEQRESLRAAVRTQLQAATTARRAGDAARAREAYARVLVLEPENAEAAAALRELEQQAMARTQADRAARARMDDVVANVKARAAAEGAEGYDLDQRLALLQAGDTTAGLRELRAWVDAHPKDRAARQRIGAAVAERAQAEEARGQRERALALYEQAGALRGDTPPEWASRMQALRRVLSEELYAAGVKVQRTDLAAAIARFEASLRYDPGNVKASTRLREAQAAQAKLQRLPATK